MALVRGCNKLALVASSSGVSTHGNHMSVAGDTGGSGSWVASGDLGVPKSSTSPESAACCSVHLGLQVHKMGLENTGYKPQAYFDFNL